MLFVPMRYLRSIRVRLIFICCFLLTIFSLVTFSSSAPAINPLDTTISQFSDNYTGKILTPTEQIRIANYLQSQNIIPNNNPPLSPRFILHDTSILLSPSFLQKEINQGRGPLGLGVNAFLPRNENAAIARPDFYEFRRPSTTKFEQASDIISRDDREVVFRKIWSLISESAQQQALDNALLNLGLTPTEITTEQQKANEQLNANIGNVFSTGTWAIENICNRSFTGDQSILNNPSMVDDLNANCNGLANYFNTRNDRIKSSVAIEIIQVGVKSQKGNQTTCVPSNKNIAPLPKPPYSETQYRNVVNLYLKSAQKAGKFPEITTHFALDAFDKIDGHCDPRCFNLNKLYNSIADVMGHPVGSIYGITPSYGTKSGINNVWWDSRICYSPRPA